jgi:hypothetical protein
MSGMQVGQPRNARAMLPTPPTGQPVASYGTYEAAQRAVDYLSDAEFPVENLTVVGEDLQLVERVTGRLTYAKAAGAGAGSGAWLGLFFGILISFVARDAGFSVVIVAVLLGAAFGILLGIGSFALTGGRRDFSSFTQMVARRYVVLCRGGDMGKAYWMLQRLPDNPQLPDGARPIGVSDVPPDEPADRPGF